MRAEVAWPGYGRRRAMRASNAAGLPRSASSESAAATSALSTAISASREAEREQREHSLRSVQKREAFFGFERERRDCRRAAWRRRRASAGPCKSLRLRRSRLERDAQAARDRRRLPRSLVKESRDGRRDSAWRRAFRPRRAERRRNLWQWRWRAEQVTARVSGSLRAGADAAGVAANEIELKLADLVAEKFARWRACRSRY